MTSPSSSSSPCSSGGLISSYPLYLYIYLCKCICISQSTSTSTSTFPFPYTYTYISLSRSKPFLLTSLSGIYLSSCIFSSLLFYEYSFQLFQCLEAPDPKIDDGGMTTFANSIKIIREAPPHLLELWKKVK